MAKVRAVRLSDKESELIQKFLSQNPIFDFSSLARTAILKFIANPEIKLQGVQSTGKKQATRGIDGQL